MPVVSKRHSAHTTILLFLLILSKIGIIVLFQRKKNGCVRLAPLLVLSRRGRGALSTRCDAPKGISTRFDLEHIRAVAFELLGTYRILVQMFASPRMDGMFIRIYSYGIIEGLYECSAVDLVAIIRHIRRIASRVNMLPGERISEYS